jgi:hypothetical protein
MNLSNRRNWIALLFPGASLLGSSCAQDIRNSIVAAGLDFVEQSAGTVLDALVPVEEFVAGAEE